MAEFVGLIIELGKCFAEPIKRQFSYLCCFQSNILALEDEARKLRNAKEGLQRRVDAVKRNTETILPEVEAWLTGANESDAKVNGIPKTTSISCLNLKYRYIWGKKAMKRTNAIKQLLGDPIRHLVQISTPALPTSMVSEPSKWSMEFESRKKLEENIMAALKDDDVNMIGICGQGGIGKTTLAERIMDKVRGEKMFDEVVKVVVTQKVSVTKIQGEFADLLGVRLEVESLSARAHALRTRLEGVRNNILVVIDDAWEVFELEMLGINWDICQGCCKVILTSRNEDVCRGMDVQKIIRVDVLQEDEAWKLFREKAGDCVEDARIRMMAKDVAKECRGLPLALIIVGKTLKDEKSESIWQDSLDQLRKSDPTDMPQVLRYVYKPVKLSYTYLNSPHAQSVFLLCGLFPEDCNISIDHLIMYCIGLRIFDEGMTIKQVRNRMHRLVKSLQSCFLLLDGSKENHVKMHDIVRDMAIYVAASREESNFMKNLDSTDWLNENSGSDCTWISLISQYRGCPFPEGLQLPCLRLLMTQNVDFNVTEDSNLVDNFFNGMKGLTVLSIELSRMWSLPTTIESLKNLRTLRLEFCDVECISAVGKLTSLEILSCYNCINIKELTSDLKSLSCLKLLEMNGCPFLSRVSPGVVSNLTNLEDIRMCNRSFSGWEVDIGSESNVSLKELEFLTKLTCVHIRIDNLDLVGTPMRFPPKVNNFFIDVCSHGSEYLLPSYFAFDRIMRLRLEKVLPLADWVTMLLRRTDKLYLEGDGSKVINFIQLDRLVDFNFGNCSTVKELVDARNWSTDVFQLLEKMHLENICSMERICSAPIPVGSNSFAKLKELMINQLDLLPCLWSFDQNVSLTNLRSMYICYCLNLQNLFPLSMGSTLSQLEILVIHECEQISEIFVKDVDSPLVLQKLKDLTLGKLPNLASFSSGVLSLKFPQLTSVDITSCPKLMSFPPILEGNEDSLFYQKEAAPGIEQLSLNEMNVTNLWKTSLQSVFLKNLKSIHIRNCANIKNLFLLSKATNLSQLEVLEIFFCRQIQEIFLEDDKERKGNYHIVLPKLNKLSLEGLFSLTTFSNVAQNMELPSLQSIEISLCPKLIALTRNLNENDGLLFTPKDVFPRLEHLSLQSMDGVRRLWTSSHQTDFLRNLKSIHIFNCENIKNLFLLSMATNLAHLETLEVQCCERIQEIFLDDDHERNGRYHLVFLKLKKLLLERLPSLTTFISGIESMKLPRLEVIEITSCPQLVGSLIHDLQGNGLFFNRNVSFPSLRHLKIDGNVNIKNLFPSSTAAQLEVLHIWNCEQIQEIFMHDVESDGNYHLSFPKLKKLSLRRLPKLAILSNGLQSIDMNQVTSISIEHCPQLRSLVHNLPGTDQGFFSQKVTVAELEDLILNFYGANICNIWNQCSITFFTQLLELDIRAANSINNLFSPSVSMALVWLRYLNIGNCEKMTEIINKELEEYDYVTVFPSLKELTLEKMPKLETLCRWKHVYMPELQQVMIDDCPLMKTFIANGSITTPDLRSIVINRVAIEMVDLNYALQHHLETKGTGLVAVSSRILPVNHPILTTGSYDLITDSDDKMSGW